MGEMNSNSNNQKDKYSKYKNESSGNEEVKNEQKDKYSKYKNEFSENEEVKNKQKEEKVRYKKTTDGINRKEEKKDEQTTNATSENKGFTRSKGSKGKGKVVNGNGKSIGNNNQDGYTESQNNTSASGGVGLLTKLIPGTEDAVDEEKIPVLQRIGLFKMNPFSILWNLLGRLGFNTNSEDFKYVKWGIYFMLSSIVWNNIFKPVIVDGINIIKHIIPFILPSLLFSLLFYLASKHGKGFIQGIDYLFETIGNLFNIKLNDINKQAKDKARNSKKASNVKVVKSNNKKQPKKNSTNKKTSSVKVVQRKTNETNKKTSGVKVVKRETNTEEKD